MRTVLLCLLLPATACTDVLFDVGDVRSDGGGAPVNAGADSGPTADAAPGGAAESLAVSLQTTPVGGEYAPRNIVAVWIEDQNGGFVQTIGRWSATRTQHLVAWVQASGQDTDAVSGATRLNHDDTISTDWDVGAAGLDDGTYSVRVEVADQNSTTPDENHQATFTFEKNGEASVQDLSGQGLTSITLDYSGR